MKQLYHRESGLPQIPELKLQLLYSLHAKKRAAKYKIKRLPEWLVVSAENVVEVEISDYRKYLVRTSYTQKKDILLAIVVYPAYGVVKTCWLNNKEDHHLSQDKTKYIPYENV